MVKTSQPNIDGVGGAVKGFYQQNPFPFFDLREYPTFHDLKLRASGYVRRLDQCIGSRARILEVGCGTGQLTNYLAHINTRTVIGADFSRASLDLGNKLRNQLGFDNLHFIQSDLFHSPFPEEYFDVVICHGVLHHTGDPHGGVRSLAGLLRPGGALALGLYHRLGRRSHRAKIRRGRREGGLDSDHDVYCRENRSDVDERVYSSWLADQCSHPHESGHLIVEAALWLRENGLFVTGSLPSLEPGAGFWGKRPFFDSTGLSRWRRNRFVYLLCDLRLWLRSVENGYFVIFGRKG